VQPEIGTISLDFSAARSGKNIDFVLEHGFPNDKTLGVGVVDARNVWKVIPSEVMSVFTKLTKAKVANVRVQPSGSLQFCPWDFLLETSDEVKNHPAANVLAFAVQKLDEVVIAAKAFHNPEVLQEHEVAWNAFATKRAQTLSPHAVTSAKRLQAVSEADLTRTEPYKVRRLKQLTSLPALPTTTIGSFPQTTEIRRLRAQWKKGSLTDQEYKEGIDQQIAYCIGIQEAIGLDVLVHGEPERTDMVEHFAQQMEGFLFTSHGWVQSFGSRCVRPPIFWNDIVRPKPMTVREFVVAQKLTKKPVKGMLTGPITILNWSFPRADVTRKEQAYQVGLCIRDEIADLEAAGCQVIQVDEPALREGMPLRDGAKEEYLLWAVDSFRLATAGAKNETQIQTHMCYCEFKDCMGAIDRMDTDVNSIENSRSDNATLEAFRAFGYNKGFGPGTYDIHSPVVPSMLHQKVKIESFLEVLAPDNIVINPDCGLKTRTWPETIAALRNMVTATQKIRAERGLL
jgi:5-methyltetrahydropteroyltriglutamate--homocysteine methyltransferase